MAADANVLFTSFTISGVTVAAINWLKRSKYFPWITKEKIFLLRVLSAIGATAGGAGIGHVWNPVEHSFLIEGITWVNCLNFLWAITKQFTMNETIFQATKPKNGATPAAPADAAIKA